MPPDNQGTSLLSTEAAASASADNEPEIPENEVGGEQGATGEGDPGPEGQAEGEQEQAPAEELEDVEFGGKTYKVPKELKAGIMMQADYTQKTQAVAEQRRALEAREAEHRQQVEAVGASFQRRVEIAQLDTALQQFGNVDWAQVESRDPIQAQSLFRQYSQIRDAKAAAEQQLQQDERQRLSGVSAQTARRLQETRAVAMRDIKGWTPDVDAKVTEFAKSHGLTDQELINVIDPRTYKLLHLAWLGSQLAQKAAPTKPGNGAGTPEIRPLRQVGQARSRPPAAGLSDTLSAEEWVKRRNEQVRKRRAG